MHPLKLSLAGALAAFSCTAAHAQGAEEAAALRAQVQALKAQVEALEKRLDLMADQPAVAQPTPLATATASKSPGPIAAEWKGAPTFSEGEERSFKVKGRIQVDATYVTPPASLEDDGLGYAAEFRRLRLGAEGDLGGGVGYELELELSDNAVELVDTFVTYERGGWTLTAGNHNPFQSLDELTGDTTGSFMERAAFTDAFNFERRLGVSAQYARGPWLSQTGLFADDVSALSNDSDGPDGGDENDSFSIDQRVVFAPKAGDTQLHFAGSAHWRQLARLSEADTVYRQRPYAHGSNTRLIGTPAMQVSRELNYGLEAAAVRGPWHMAAETHWLSATRPDATDPTFFGGYLEVGYFLTRDDSRAYGDGMFGRTKPQRTIDEGGLGAVQVNLRYDYLSLDDGPVQGGEQNGYLAAIIWSPLDYLRFNLNYGYLAYRGATMLPDGRRDYGVHVAGARMELDF